MLYFRIYTSIHFNIFLKKSNAGNSLNHHREFPAFSSKLALVFIFYRKNLIVTSGKYLAIAENISVLNRSSLTRASIALRSIVT